MSSDAKPRRAVAGRVGSVLVATLIFVAAAHAWRVTSALEWPNDPDLFRDVATAQTMLNGDLFGDPFYADETLWYNPLVPTVVAATSWGTGIGVPRLYARAGVVFNLLAPIAFAGLVWLVAGPWAALTATAIFLFLPSPERPTWAWASYSPWLFPAIVAQALFYASLAALHRAYRLERWMGFVVVGCLLGTTFLAHTAPALLIGSIMALDVAVSLGSSTPGSRFRASGTLLSLACATVVSLPLTLSIVGRYHLRVLNTAPASWESGEMLLANLPTLASGILSISGILALIGFWVTVREPTTREVRRVLVGWSIANAGWLVWIYVCQLAQRRGWSIGTVVPGYHFLFYWRALGAVLGGIGAFSLARQAARFAERLVARLHDDARVEGLAAVFSILALVGAMPFLYSRFVSRYDFTAASPGPARRNGAHPDSQAYEWIRKESPIDSVFLSSDHVSLYVVGPTGRKVVAVDSSFSNPYVDVKPRIRARKAMWEALRVGDTWAFCRATQPFRVTHVISGDQDPDEWAARIPPFLEREFTAGSMTIWRVIGC